MRRAFTVVELLVVIAIIGVLVALTLPAVQYARETARKTQCASQLKQIATGAIAHNTAFEYFPNAGGRDGQPRSKTTDGAPRRAIEQDWGVFYQILPYIEQKPTYEKSSDAEVAAQKIKLYFCPSRRPPTAVSGSTANGLTASDLRGGVDYAGCSGDGQGTNPFPDNASYNRQNGFIIPRPGVGTGNERITQVSVGDGLSNVMMFGERRFHPKPPNAQPDEDNGYFNGYSWDTVRWGISAPRNVQDSGSLWRFGGAHSGVVLIAMGDGSVRPLRYGALDDTAFRQLTNRNDKKFPQIQ